MRRLIILVGLASAAFAVRADGEQKIAFVNLEKIFEKYQKTVELNAKLARERKERIAERKTMVEEINKLKDEADLLRDEAKRKKEAVVDEKVRDLYRFEEKVKKEALQKQARLQEEILGDMKGVIAQIGKSGGYDAVLAVTGDDIGYHADRLDITDRAVKLLNEKYGEKKK